jgi:signal transduction histidine kinase
MTSRTASRLAWSLWALFVAGAGVLIWIGTLEPSRDVLSGTAQLVAFFGMVTVGALVASRRPENPLGWLFCLLALGLISIGLLSLWGDVALIGRLHPARGGVVAEWFGQWVWFPIMTLQLSFPILLFPTGHLPSPRWRPVAWCAVASMVVGSISFALYPWRLDRTYHRLANPYGIPALRGVLGVGTIAGIAFLALLSLASFSSLVLRYRRATHVEREQLKWLFYPAGLFVVFAVAGNLVHWSDAVGNTIYASVTALIPVGAGMAILKYRLYDIDVVINKTLVYGSLAAFITAVYVAIVVGIGTALGRGASRPNLGLSILATAVVAVAFQPVRDRVQRFANRLVYGVRATPYEVLAGFVRQVGGTYAAEDVLPRMARALAEGTAAASATIWLKVGSSLRAEASWPASPTAIASLPMPGERLPEIDGMSLTLPVAHRGEILGAASLRKPAGEPLSSTERKLAQDLAGQAGLVVRNVGLTEDLLARLHDIESSRSRMVSAEDEERTRIERRIRDGARRELEAVAAALDDAASSLRPDPARALSDLTMVGERTQIALESLREVARGIYPPLLADKGLVAALEAQARRAAAPVTLDGHAVGRYAEDVESAVYLCCIEAVENAIRHSGPSTVRIALREEGGELTFEVVDDGIGFEPDSAGSGIGLTGMRDRMAALDGTLVVESLPGRGTILRGAVPITVPVPT